MFKIIFKLLVYSLYMKLLYMKQRYVRLTIAVQNRFSDHSSERVLLKVFILLDHYYNVTRSKIICTNFYAMDLISLNLLRGLFSRQKESSWRFTEHYPLKNLIHIRARNVLERQDFIEKKSRKKDCCARNYEGDGTRRRKDEGIFKSVTL